MWWPASGGGPMSGQEGESLASVLAGLRQEVRDGLDRMEKQWGDPVDENGALRAALRAELLSLRAGSQEFPFSSGSLARRVRTDGTGRSECQRTRTPHDGTRSISFRMNTRAIDRQSTEDRIQTPVVEMSGSMSGVRVSSWRLIHRHGTAFDSVISLVILLSSMFVGVEIHCDLEGDTQCQKSCVILQHVCMAIFVMELSIRFFADGRKSWHCGWFRFDFALVLAGVLSDWVVGPILRHSVGDHVQFFLDIQSKVLILRILRLTRLVRAVRLFEQFRQMWKLVNGLMRSFSTVTSAFVITALTVFIFACLGIEMVLNNDSLMEDPTTAKVVQENFSTLPKTMLTLIQFATGDSIASVYRPLMEKAWHLTIYFGMVWLIVTITLMNLITAVIVDSAIAQAGEDRDEELQFRRHRLRDLEPRIREVFQELCRAGTDKLTRSGFISGLRDMQATGMKHLPRELREVLQSDLIVEVCDFLDADRSGVIDEREFVDGIFNLLLQSVPIETTQMLQMLRAQNDMLKKLASVHHRKSPKVHASKGPAPVDLSDGVETASLGGSS